MAPLEYGNGHTYDGWWNETERKGRGMIVFADTGGTYRGQWDCFGQRTGQGIMTFANGDKYEGEWRDDEMHGKGMMLYGTGNFYEGGWVDGIKHGWGREESVFLDRYEGEFEGGQRSGIGKRITFDGNSTRVDSQYFGMWSQGQRHGKGELRSTQFDNGARLEGSSVSFSGEFNSDVECFGIRTMEDGSVVEGVFDESGHFLHGRERRTNCPLIYEITTQPRSLRIGGMTAIVKYVSGNIFEGSWSKNRNSQVNGVGKMNYINGDVYEGGYKDGQSSGKGVFIFANGDIYDGLWRDGKLNGKAVLTFASGDVQEGLWKDGKLNGRALLTTNASGQVQESVWRNGVMIGMG